MRPGREADPTPPSSAEVKNKSRAIPVLSLTLNLLTTTIVAPPSNASKWQMGFNSAFKGLRAFVAYDRVKATYVSCRQYEDNIFTE